MQRHDDKLPGARVHHRLKNRVRLKIPRKRGEASYFKALAVSLSGRFGIEVVETNPVTGCVVLSGPGLDLGGVASFAREEHLFDLLSDQVKPEALSVLMVRRFKDADRSIRHISGERIDMPGAIFIGLLLFGALELIRGNFKAPPWYTAIWYAMGVFTKFLLDEAPEEN